MAANRRKRPFANAARRWFADFRLVRSAQEPEPNGRFPLVSAGAPRTGGWKPGIAAKVDTRVKAPRAQQACVAACGAMVPAGGAWPSGRDVAAQRGTCAATCSTASFR